MYPFFIVFCHKKNITIAICFNSSSAGKYLFTMGTLHDKLTRQIKHAVFGSENYSTPYSDLTMPLNKVIQD